MTCSQVSAGPPILFLGKVTTRARTSSYHAYASVVFAACPASSAGVSRRALAARPTSRIGAILRSHFNRLLGSVVQFLSAIENFIQLQKLPQDRSNHIVLKRCGRRASPRAGRRGVWCASMRWRQEDIRFQDKYMKRGRKLSMLMLIGILLTVQNNSTSTATSTAAAAAATAAAAAAPIPTTITIAPDATASERHAATELQAVLRQIAGAEGPHFRLASASATLASTPQIAVGYGAAVQLGVSATALAELGLEGFIASTGTGVPAGSVVLTGGKGASRGVLYATNNFTEAIGVHFLAQDTTVFPSSLPVLPTMNPELQPFIPALEYRQQFEWACNQPTNASVDLNVHLGLNKDSLGSGGTNLDAAHGGAVIYAPNPGFVHTSWALVPPSIYNNKSSGSDYHPEWFATGQLCWKAAGLKEFLAKRVQDLLREQPNATIISVSQNDDGSYCKTGEDLVQSEAEGSPMAPMLQTVNYVADSIKKEFPGVAIDTLAYQYTRPAPNITKPRPNVIVRLCSIECNFGAPLSDPSNAAFQKDMEDWAKVSQRTYIWNYQTNFGSYITPFPDLDAVGPNVRYFSEHGVRGIFQEGSYNGPGGDLAELRDYLTAKMMWDPLNDPEQLIDTFMRGYYGEAAAPHMKSYLQTVQGSVRNQSYYLREGFDGINAPFLTPAVILQSAASLTAARNAATQPLHQQHVNRSSMAVWYVALHRYEELTEYAKANGISWPMETTMEASFDTFATAVFLTERAYGAQVVLREGGPPLDVAALHATLFKPCPAGWKRSAPQPAPCLPQCPSGALGHSITPAKATASSVYPAGQPVSVNGKWCSSGFAPQWIEFELPAGAILEVLEATVEMEPVGFANHSILVDGTVAGSWSGKDNNGDVLTWKPDKPIAAKTVRILTTGNGPPPSWVAWEGVTMFSC